MQPSTTRRAFLFAIAMALGKLDALKANGGQLTCDLNQWSHVVFTFGKETIKVPTRKVFESLKEV